MASGDWIKLHRRLLENPIMQHDGMCRLWVYLLLKANWKDAKWLIPGTTKQVDVPRGSLIVGRQTLHRALYPKCRKEDPAPLTVWRWLLSLSDLGCVTVQNMYNHCSLVTICNYSTYQQSEPEQCTADEQPMNNRRTTDEQPMNTIEESKEGEESKEEKELKTDSPEPCSEPLTTFVFPVVGDKDVLTWTLPVRICDILVQAYPNLRIDDELRKAVAWCETNKAKRKTAGGMSRFLNGWMERAQNNGRSRTFGGNRRSTADGYVVGPGQRYQGPAEPTADSGIAGGQVEANPRVQDTGEHLPF